MVSAQYLRGALAGGGNLLAGRPKILALLPIVSNPQVCLQETNHVYCDSQFVSNPQVCLQETNRPTEGRVSTDRSVEAALLNTTPWPVTKSSANDFAP